MCREPRRVARGSELEVLSKMLLFRFHYESCRVIFQSFLSTLKKGSGHFYYLFRHNNGSTSGEWH
jgi:hypothetical protein